MKIIIKIVIFGFLLWLLISLGKLFFERSKCISVKENIENLAAHKLIAGLSSRSEVDIFLISQKINYSFNRFHNKYNATITTVESSDFCAVSIQIYFDNNAILKTYEVRPTYTLL